MSESWIAVVCDDVVLGRTLVRLAQARTGATSRAFDRVSEVLAALEGGAPPAIVVLGSERVSASDAARIATRVPCALWTSAAGPPAWLGDAPALAWFGKPDVTAVVVWIVAAMRERPRAAALGATRAAHPAGAPSVGPSLGIAVGTLREVVDARGALVRGSPTCECGRARPSRELRAGAKLMWWCTGCSRAVALAVPTD